MRNEDTSRVTSLGGQSTTVKQKYDEEGNLTEVTRSFLPNPTGIGSLITVWEYDRANRPTRQTEPDATFERRWYDAAGNLDSVSTRRSLTIAMTYDSLNRLRTRVLPAVSISLPGPQIEPATQVNTYPYTYSWTADNQSFQYTADGQISRAVNKDAIVARTYHANGQVLADTLYVKSTDRASDHPYPISYAYDKNGRPTSMTAPAQFTGGPTGYEIPLAIGCAHECHRR